MNDVGRFVLLEDRFGCLSVGQVTVFGGQENPLLNFPLNLMLQEKQNFCTKLAGNWVYNNDP